MIGFFEGEIKSTFELKPRAEHAPKVEKISK